MSDKRVLIRNLDIYNPLSVKQVLALLADDRIEAYSFLKSLKNIGFY